MLSSLRSLVLVHPLLTCLLNSWSRGRAAAEVLPTHPAGVWSPLSIGDRMSSQGTVSLRCPVF